MDSIDNQTDQKEEIKQEEATVEELKTGPTILLDSSFVAALLNPDDSNHKTVKSIFGFVEPHNCKFHIPLFVFYEVLSKIVHTEKRVSVAIRIFNSFVNNLPGVLFSGTNPNLQEIINRYKTFARKREVKDLQSNDFLIVTEGMLSGSIILTCDHGMYEKVKAYHEDIFYVATHSKKYKSDVSKFIERFLQITRNDNLNGT